MPPPLDESDERTPCGDESKRPVVLIVEDERSLADLYARYLEDSYDVRTAYTGEQALELLDDDVDIALLDRRLKEWTGDQLLAVIRDREIDCQVAMVTAVTPDFDIVDLPIDDYLTKPISREDLLETIEELLLWRETDITHQELLALVSRRIALEGEKREDELEASSEYAGLKRQIGIVESRLDISPEKVSTTKLQPDSCSQCEVRWDISVGETIGSIKLGSNVWKCTQCGQIEKVPSPTGRRVARR